MTALCSVVITDITADGPTAFWSCEWLMMMELSWHLTTQ